MKQMVRTDRTFNLRSRMSPDGKWIAGVLSNVYNAELTLRTLSPGKCVGIRTLLPGNCAGIRRDMSVCNLFKLSINKGQQMEVRIGWSASCIDMREHGLRGSSFCCRVCSVEAYALMAPVAVVSKWTAGGQQLCRSKSVEMTQYAH